jgi:type I restriction enzyme, S subunit
MPENFNYSELMENELPEGWVECSLGDIIKVSSGDGLTSVNMNKEGVIPVYGGNGITGFHDKSNIKEESIVIGRVGYYCGSVHLTPETAWVTDNALRVSFSQSNIDKKFLFWLLKSLSLGQYSGSSAQPVVSGAKLYQVPISLPPLAEQTRIVAKLDAAFGHLETLKTSLARIPEMLKKFRQTVLTQAITGKLTEDINNKTIPLFSQLEKFCESSFYGPRFSNDDYNVNGIPTVRTTDMTDNGKIEITERTPRVLVLPEKIETFKVTKGDLLITRTGSIGKMAIYESDALAIPSAYLIRFRFKKTVSTKFVFYCLTSPYGQKIMGLEATAITQANLNANKIKTIEIPDIPLEEQHEIVNRVEALFAKADALEAQYGSLKAKLDALPQALLAKAFRGALVPQNPADEPASALLARLKSAPAPGGKTKTGQTKLAFMGE